MATYTGDCIFCGQSKMVIGGESLTEDKINELATLQCDCDEAQYLQKIERKKTYAEANVRRLFQEDCPGLAKMIMETVDGLAHQRIKKVNITNAEGVKATLTAKENSIKVERTEVLKKSLED